MDDTRDIAINASASASAAHHRLDGINGQIRKLGDSHEKMREDFHQALYDPEHGLVPHVADLKATIRTSLKVAGAIAAAALSVSTAVTVYLLTHVRATPQKPATATAPRKTTAQTYHGQDAASVARIALRR